MSRVLNILLVEDSEQDAELLLGELRHAGFDPRWHRVETEADFLAQLESSPDLILSDYSLPHFNGLRAAELLRERGLDIPFILLSGEVGEEIAVEAMKRGAADYLLKDRMARLGHAVERALGQRRIQDERKRAEEALRASEERLRQLAENISAVLWITDPAMSQVLYVSPAYEKVWGRDCESLYRTPHAWLEAIHPEDQPRVRQAALKKQQRGEYDEVYRVVRPDGSVRWIRDRAFPIRNETGEVCRLVGTAEDITEQRSLEDQLRQAQKMEAIGQLAGGVAHDFNNILTVIQGHSELLTNRDDLNPEMLESLNQIMLAGGRAANLTRQLLTFSRQQAIQPRPLDLNQVIADLNKMLVRIIGEDVRLQFDPAPQLPQVKADAGMIEQVLMNLVVNARDAMPAGGNLVVQTETIHLDDDHAKQDPQTRAGEFVKLTVRDSGCGMSPEVMARVFEPFFTTKPAGKGTGLGLATVFGIVKQHNGWVEVDSVIGWGTTFRVFLPVSRSAATEFVQRAAPGSMPRGTETVLLVEDESAVRLLAKMALQRLGYHVLEAGSGVAALEVWDEHADEIELVVTDMVLPEGLTGRELAQRLRARKPGLKVLYTSGYSTEIVGRNFIVEQDIHFLQKPYTPQKLAQAMRECLDAVH